jgi:two-component system LytT family sensor kinase
MKPIPLGHKNFWIAQGIGWAIFALVNIIVQALAGLPAWLIFKNTLYATGAGLLVTTAYRHLIRKVDWTRQQITVLILFLFGTSFVLALLWIIFITFLFYLDGKGIIHPSEIAGNLLNGCLIFFIWNLIYFFFQYFSKFQTAEVEKWQLEAQVKEAQLNTLKTQIRPHFMFNTLNNILALILEDKHKARAMLVNFSELLRYSLQMSKASFVRLEEEIDMVRRYLQLLSIQYEGRLQYEIELDTDLNDHPVPPMMLQFLVENGIKHGIDQRPEGGSILLRVFKENQDIVFEVRNTGQFEESASKPDQLGIGLHNIRERLALLYKRKAVLDIREIPDFVVATIKIPKNL